MEFGVTGLLKWTAFNGVFLSSVVSKRNVHSYRFISFIALLRPSTHNNAICCNSVFSKAANSSDLKSDRCPSTVEVKLLRFWEEVKRGGELIPIQPV
ncbi:unnamed protein product [Brassica oleracea]